MPSQRWESDGEDIPMMNVGSQRGMDNGAGHQQEEGSDTSNNNEVTQDVGVKKYWILDGFVYYGYEDGIVIKKKEDIPGHISSFRFGTDKKAMMEKMSWRLKG